jgi:L-glyceraldehyde 3-phosphate reductase
LHPRTGAGLLDNAPHGLPCGLFHSFIPPSGSTPMTYHADPKRYDALPYRRVGRSGLVLPAISLGLWHNFGDTTSIATQRQLLRTAFDLGINHFDLANNYGPPYGSAETNFGRLLREDFKAHRDELIISSKAGWDMWPGPYGKGGGSRKYVLASLDQSLQRLGLDYVDIFYSHRFDPDTPLEETASALAQAVQQGKALYIGISSYSAGKTREIAALLREWKVPLLIHQPAYNLFNRWIEKDLLDATDELGAGVIAFTPLAQGLLTNKYLKGIPDDARINRPGGGSLKQEHLSEANIERARALDKIAQRRGQTLAQLALTWTLRDPRVSSALIGASRPEQIVDNVAALSHAPLSAEELAEIDKYAVEGGVNLWEKPSTDFA